MRLVSTALHSAPTTTSPVRRSPVFQLDKASFPVRMTFFARSAPVHFFWFIFPFLNPAVPSPTLLGLTFIERFFGTLLSALIGQLFCCSAFARLLCRVSSSKICFSLPWMGYVGPPPLPFLLTHHPFLTAPSPPSFPRTLRGPPFRKAIFY